MPHAPGALIALFLVALEAPVSTEGGIRSPSAPLDANEQAISALVEDPAFAELSPADHTLAEGTFVRLDATSRSRFLRCLDRRVRERSALVDRASDGSTFLEEIASWTIEEDGSKVVVGGLSRAQLVGEILYACGDPGAITQGAGMHNTCTVTAIEYMLARDNPAELARLAEGLAVRGSVSLESGERVTRVEDSIAPDRYLHGPSGKLVRDPSGTIPDPRATIDRLFQAALMDFANGGDRYSDKEDLSFGFESSYTGLYPEQQRRALESVFDRPYAELRGRQAIRAIENQPHLAPVMVDIEWKDSSHAVVVDRIEGGRVYFQNPMGPWHRALTVLSDPVRRIEDHHGKESMRLDEFKRIFQCAYLPDH
jgi:hypothetical protein